MLDHVSSWNWSFNDSISKWFRPDGITGSNIFDPVSGHWSNLKPRPNALGGNVSGEWVGPNYDSTHQFADIVVYDSLKFKERPLHSGTFVFGDTFDSRWFVACPDIPQCTDTNFMPLKDKGFRYDSPHSRFIYDTVDLPCFSHNNFAYTMEIHRSFTYQTGLTFVFVGDDDVWCYFNNKLLIDLGGMHSARGDTVLLDTIATKCGMAVGATYPFDFFYCERCVPGSHIHITTNLQIFTPPVVATRSWHRDYGTIN